MCKPIDSAEPTERSTKILQYAIKTLLGNTGYHSLCPGPDRFVEIATEIDSLGTLPKLLSTAAALAALGIMPDGFCFCPSDRDPTKPDDQHSGECLEARAALQGVGLDNDGGAMPAAVSHEQPPIKFHSKTRPGVCRVCGCTQENACNLSASGGDRWTCSWTDDSKTLCTNQDCTRIASVLDMIEACAQVADEAAKLHRPIPAHLQDNGAWELVADKIDDVATEIRDLIPAFLENC